MPGRRAFSCRVGGAWACIERVRRRVLARWDAAGDPGTGRAVAMVAAELLENGIKHAGPARRGAPLALRIEATRGGIRVVVENRADAADVGIDRLADALRDLNRAASPEAGYRDRMLAVARGGPGGPAGLGLARIAGEARARLGLERLPGVVRVTALLPAPRSGGPGATVRAAGMRRGPAAFFPASG